MAGGVLKHWRFVTPFGIESASQFRSPPPPDLDSRVYTRDFNEVLEVGRHRQHRPAAAQDRRGAVLQRGARRGDVESRGEPGVERAAAVAGGAGAIAGAAEHGDQRRAGGGDGHQVPYPLWRPETAIHHADADGNPRTQAQPAFQPLIPAPCFPSYGSAHAAASYAARRVAEAFFGEDEQTIVLEHPAVPGVVFEYGRFEEITQDIDDARVTGGIHFRFDQRAGARMGRDIGRWVVQHHLRRLPAGGQD